MTNSFDVRNIETGEVEELQGDMIDIDGKVALNLTHIIGISKTKSRDRHNYEILNVFTAYGCINLLVSGKKNRDSLYDNLITLLERI